MNQETFNDPMMKDIEQQTAEWNKLRAGKCTASRVKDILPGKRGDYLKSRSDYIDECVVGRFGITKNVYVSKRMERGQEYEGYARSKYESKHGVIVSQVSFKDHPYIVNAGYSPDGLVGDEGLIEIKVPDSDTQAYRVVNDIISGELDESLIPQLAFGLACYPERKWVDFISFDDRVHESFQYFEVRYYRDDKYISYLENEVIKFNLEVDKKYQMLKERIGG